MSRLTAIDLIGAFNYYAQDRAQCENEHCILFIARYEGDVVASNDVAYGCRWVPLVKLLRDVERHPKRPADPGP